MVHNFHTKFCGTVNLSLSLSFYLKRLHTLNSQDSSIMTSSLLCSPRMGLPISEILRASSSSGVGCPGKDRRQQVIIFSLHAQNEDSEMRQTRFVVHHHGRCVPETAVSGSLPYNGVIIHYTAIQSQRSCHMIYQSQHTQKQLIARKRHEKLKPKLKSFRVPIKEEVVFMVPLKEWYRKIRVN